MSEDIPADQIPFDLERVKELMELMEKHGLTEVNLKRGNEKWCLRRGPDSNTPMMIPGGYPAPPVGYPPPAWPADSGAPQSAAPAPTEQGAAAEDSSLVAITSPTVGTFYSSPNPDDPPFVQVGTQVQSDSVVCIVEAMKVFNQIPAEVSGKIVEILVQNGDPVEFGQELFKVRPG